jgi:hypothetical protein
MQSKMKLYILQKWSNVRLKARLRLVTRRVDTMLEVLGGGEIDGPSRLMATCRAESDSLNLAREKLVAYYCSEPTGLSSGQMDVADRPRLGREYTSPKTKSTTEVRQHSIQGLPEAIARITTQEAIKAHERAEALVGKIMSWADFYYD